MITITATAPPIRIAIIDDETLFSGMLARCFGRDGGLRVVGCVASGNQGWELCAATRPELALVDIEMPDGDGLILAKRLREELPSTKVIIMTGRVDPHTAWRAAQIGVHGLMDKTIRLEQLLEVIRLVAHGGRFLGPAFKQVRDLGLTDPEAFQKVLSDRELAVLLGVAEGESDPVIGGQLGISAVTVAYHRKNLRKKLGVHDDRSLVAYALERGIYGSSRLHPARDNGHLPGKFALQSSRPKNGDCFSI